MMDEKMEIIRHKPYLELGADVARLDRHLEAFLEEEDRLLLGVWRRSMPLGLLAHDI